MIYKASFVVENDTPPAPSPERRCYLFIVSGSNPFPLERGQGVCQCVRVCISLIITLLLLSITLSLSAKEADDDGIRILPQSLTVSDDSIHLDLKITASGIRIPSGESLTLIPSLHHGKKKVELPPVVLSGSRRARFDRREETVNPDRNKPLAYHTWIGVRRGNNYTLRYCVSLPYASWMEHAALWLKQISKDCCTERVLADDVLTQDINLPSPYAPAQLSEDLIAHNRQDSLSAQPVAARKKLIRTIVPAKAGNTPQTASTPQPVNAPQAVTDLHLYAENIHIHSLEETPRVMPEIKQPGSAAATLYIDYPRGGSKVDPWFGRNRRELQKVDSLLSPLLASPYISIKEIRITGYASPDGAYYDNEALAKARSQGFRSYLTRSYGLEEYPFRTAWVAEDWEGLRRLLRGKPYEKAACFIIDNYGIFEGRERYLIDLNGGWPYQEMLYELFPRLRRMEINILYDERDEK